MEVGDVVFLKSNPDIFMTVSFVFGKSEVPDSPQPTKIQMKLAGYGEGDVECKWFVGKECKSGFFKSAMLTKKLD